MKHERLNFSPLEIKAPEPLPHAIWVGLLVLVLATSLIVKTDLHVTSILLYMFGLWLLRSTYREALYGTRLREFARANNFIYREKDSIAHGTEKLQAYKSAGDMQTVTGRYQEHRFWFGTHLRERDGNEMRFTTRQGFLRVGVKHFAGQVTCSTRDWGTDIAKKYHAADDIRRSFQERFLVNADTTDWEQVIPPALQAKLLSMKWPPSIEVKNRYLYFYQRRGLLHANRRHIEQFFELIGLVGL